MSQLSGLGCRVSGLLALGLLVAVPLLAQSSTPATDTSSDLVKAAAAARDARKKPGKVITNETVKESSRNVTVLKTPPVEPATAKQPDRDKLRKRLEVVEASIVQRQKLVAESEGELNRIERLYYAESDPKVRDTELWNRYEHARAKLSARRSDLDRARQEERSLQEQLKPIGPM